MKHHLAILTSIYLDRILEGCKTTECRFSRTRRPPFGVVNVGDTLWLKQSGGLVLATASVCRVEFVHPLGPKTLADLCSRYRDSAQADRGFFTGHTRARFATLIQLGNVCTVEPIRIIKSDRRPWVVLSEPLTGTPFSGQA